MSLVKQFINSVSIHKPKYTFNNNLLKSILKLYGISTDEMVKILGLNSRTMFYYIAQGKHFINPDQLSKLIEYLEKKEKENEG